MKSTKPFPKHLLTLRDQSDKPNTKERESPDFVVGFTKFFKFTDKTQPREVNVTEDPKA